MLDWNAMTQPEFDRLVEVLLVRRYKGQPGVRVEPIDGRGGDDGIDVGVYVDDTLDHIYQLKFFPGGMSGGHVKRRQQVKRSFTTAMEHKPREWTLVTPCNLTTPERRYVRGLRKKLPVEVTMVGRAELDEMLGPEDDLQRAFTRRPLLDALAQVGMAHAALETRDDLHQQAAAFGARVDGRSMYWGESVTVEGQTVMTTLHAKHPRAAELEPLSVELVANPAGLDEATRRQVDDFFAYGLGRTVVLPASAVSSVTMRGPVWFAGTLNDAAVELHHPRTAGQSIEAELRELDDSGDVVATWRAPVTEGGAGHAGGSLRMSVAGGVDVVFVLPAGDDTPGRVTIERREFDCRPREAARALRLLARIDSRARFDLALNGKRLVTFTATSGTYSGTDDAYWLQVADDLQVIERELDLDLPMPSSLTGHERTGIRTARLLLDGQCVLLPDLPGGSVTLTGEKSDPIAQFLSRGPGAFAIEGTLTFTLSGTPVALREVKVFRPNVRVTNGDEALAALEAGTAAGFEVELASVDGTPFRAFLPARWPDEDAPLLPSPLEIPGAEEHPAIARIRADHANSERDPVA